MSQRSNASFGRCIAVDTHPFLYASYAVSVRQYRILQSRFLHCLSHPKPACDLLMFRVVNPHVRDLHPLENEHACISHK